MVVQILVGASILVATLLVFFWKNTDARFALFYLGGALISTLLRECYMAGWHLPQIEPTHMATPLSIAFILIALHYYTLSMDRTTKCAEKRQFAIFAVKATLLVLSVFAIFEVMARLHSEAFIESLVFYFVQGVYGLIIIWGWLYSIKCTAAQQ